MPRPRLIGRKFDEGDTVDAKALRHFRRRLCQLRFVPLHLVHQVDQ